MAGNSEEKKSRTKQNEKPPALEWLAAAIGFMLVAGTIGFLIYSAVTEENTPPKLTVKTDSDNGKRRRLSRKIFSLQ